MKDFEVNIDLKFLNTFGISAKAAYYKSITETEELFMITQMISTGNHPVLILGGGSNILFTKDFKGIIIHINTEGITKTKETKDYVLIKSAAGEKWDNLVNYCVGSGFWGLENLSLIPGRVGSSPIQNIGAYGVEVKDTFEELEAIEIATGKTIVFSKKDCNFGYRDSIFKSEFRNKFIITSVTFRLSKHPKPELSYNALREELLSSGKSNPDLRDVSQAVIRIRQRKLPDPEITGSAGSFFKNPVINEIQMKKLTDSYPNIISHMQKDGSYKLAAGQLIELCGWKGRSLGDAAVHEFQALVLINKGGATGNNILELANRIIDDVWETFQVELEPEVNII